MIYWGYYSATLTDNGEELRYYLCREATEEEKQQYEYIESVVVYSSYRGEYEDGENDIEKFSDVVCILRGLSDYQYSNLLSRYRNF